ARQGRHRHDAVQELDRDARFAVGATERSEGTAWEIPYRQSLLKSWGVGSGTLRRGTGCTARTVRYHSPLPTLLPYHSPLPTPLYSPPCYPSLSWALPRLGLRWRETSPPSPSCARGRPCCSSAARGRSAR